MTVTVCSCCAGLNGQVHSNFLAHFEDNVLTLQLLEPFGLGANRIVAGSQIGSVILPGIVRGQGSRDAPLRVYDGYRGAGYDAAALVCDRSENPAGIALRKRGHAEQKDHQRAAQQLDRFPPPTTRLSL